MINSRRVAIFCKSVEDVEERTLDEGKSFKIQEKNFNWGIC